jgi:hypothetical protein
MADSQEIQDSPQKKKKNKRIIIGAILATLIVLLLLLVLPVIGGLEPGGQISTGGTTLGGNFSVRVGFCQVSFYQ